MNKTVNISISDRKCLYEYLKELGYYGLDVPFASGSELDVVLSDEYYNQYVERYKKISDAGLKVCQTHLSYDTKEDGMFERFDEHAFHVLSKQIELTKVLNCKVCVLHLSIRQSREESNKYNVYRLSKLLPVAEKHGVTIAIENTYNGESYGESYISSYEDFMFYMDYFKSPSLGICLDTGHAVVRNQNPVELFKKLEKYIVALHLHTTTENYDLHAIPFTPPYGEKIDRFELYKVISNSSYSGTLNFELRPSMKLSEEAKKAYYLLAMETVKTIMNG